MKDAARQGREVAWVEGRRLASQLGVAYRERYGEDAPPPARVVDEYLTDFLHAELVFKPLPLSTYALIRWTHAGLPAEVQVNTRIPEMGRVIDADGVENVAKCHELIHLVRDYPTGDADAQAVFPGLLGPPAFTCFRSTARTLTEVGRMREVFAEEAGRAFAVSWPHLSRSQGYQSLARLAGQPASAEGWEYLREAATDLGINRSALFKQLQLEGYVTAEEQAGRRLLLVAPLLVEDHQPA